jgi:hypothetical protein
VADRLNCPGCDAPVAAERPRCARCGFALLEERPMGRGLAPLLARAATLLAAAALICGVAAPAALRALSAASAQPSEPLSSAQAERRLAARYPRLRQADHAVIACPERRIEPGGRARCWILARVGQQRAVVVRLSERGGAVRIDD